MYLLIIILWLLLVYLFSFKTWLSYFIHLVISYIIYVFLMFVVSKNFRFESESYQTAFDLLEVVFAIYLGRLGTKLVLSTLRKADKNQ